MVTWPSRDVVATRVFLDHGLIPLAVLAVRAPAPAPAPPPDPTLRVRPAGPGDLDACVRLALEELAYSSQVGGSLARPDAEAVKRTTIRDRLGRGEPTWLAERDGVVVGMIECGLADAGPGVWLGNLLPSGVWGYVNCASVTAAERSRGVGAHLVATALGALEPGRPRRAGAWHVPLLQPAEPAVLGVLAAPRVRTAVDAVGGQARLRPALTAPVPPIRRCATGRAPRGSPAPTCTTRRRGRRRAPGASSAVAPARRAPCRRRSRRCPGSR